jgi:hypothetical protein
MSATTHTRSPAGQVDRPRTRTLLAAAALAGPFFYISSTVQALTRPGFDIGIHPLLEQARCQAEAVT